HQPQGAAAGAPFQRVDELAPQREDLVGVAKRDPPGLGQHQVSPAPREQLFAQDVLQAVDLAADGGMREVELLAGAHDAALSRHPTPAEAPSMNGGHLRCGRPPKGMPMTPQNLPKTPLLAAVAALALAGCAAVVIPPAQLASAEASIRGAEEMGAEGLPAAKLH